MSDPLTCRFETCAKPVAVKVHGLCHAHYNQHRKGQKLVPCKGTPEWIEAKVSDGQKVCSRCRRWLPLADFNERRDSTHQPTRSCCRRCNVLRRMGMTSVDYDDLLAQQGGGCAVCGATAADQGGKALAVDHDHSCCPGVGSCGKCIRGILCDACNTTLGQLNDDPERLRQLLAYLEAA